MSKENPSGLQPKDFYEDKKERSNKGIITVGIILLVFAILAIISITNPLVLIGIIWDMDIENQIMKANDQQFMYNQAGELGSNGNWENEPVRLSLTYSNNADTEIRIQMAIEVFEKIINDPNKETKIIKNEGTTMLQLKWMPQ